MKTPIRLSVLFAVVVSGLFLAGCVKEQAEPLAAPQLTPSYGSTWYEVEWPAVSNAVGYSVSTDEGGTWSAPQTATNFRKEGLVPETLYKVWVKSIGDGNKYTDSKPSQLEIMTTQAGGGDGGDEELTKLETPTLDYQANVRNARISWASVANASGYRVSVDGCATWKNQQTGLYFDYGGLTPETAYKVYVKAVGDGETYGDSDAAEVEFTTRPDELIAGEYSYKPVEWPEEIVPGQKFLIGFVTSDHVRIMDKTSTQKLAGIDLSAQYDLVNDLFPSNSVTDSYAYTIKDAGNGYYYLENPEGRTLGWTSGTDFNFSATGDNARWSIAEGNDGENLSFHIKNVASLSQVASHRGIVYTYRSDGEQSFDLFAPYAMNNIDHYEYCEPCLYMLDKPLEGGEPVDPEPEPGEDLMYVRVTDPDKIYSGDRCILVGYCSAGVIRVMNHTENARPSGVDFSEYYVSTDNAFVSNEQSDAYSFTITKSGSTVWLTNPNGKYVTHSSGTELSYASNSSSNNAKWTMSAGAKANTIRLQNQNATDRAIAYRYASQNTFGAYATSNLTAANTEYYDVMLYVLKSIESSGEEPGGEETGFPAQWDIPNAALTGGKCYAATGNTGAYVTVSGASGLTFGGSGDNRYLSATGWNATGAAWVIEVPVTNLTATETTVELTTYSSSSGPKTFVVSYSTDGINYTSTNKTYTCTDSNRATSIEFIPTVTGFPSSLFIKLQVSGSAAAGSGNIAAGGTSRLYKVKLMKWYK